MRNFRLHLMGETAPLELLEAYSENQKTVPSELRKLVKTNITELIGHLHEDHPAMIALVDEKNVKQQDFEYDRHL